MRRPSFSGLVLDPEAHIAEIRPSANMTAHSHEGDPDARKSLNCA